MTAVIHLSGERGWCLCSMVSNNDPNVTADASAVTCGRCLRCGAIPNPLVCECPDTDADPARNFGQCSTCKRKPLALMAVQS